MNSSELLCRTCEKTYHVSELHAIFKHDDTIHDFFTSNQHLSTFLFKFLQINSFDGLPKQVCSACLEILKTIKSFYELCEKSRISFEQSIKTESIVLDNANVKLEIPENERESETTELVTNNEIPDDDKLKKIFIENRKKIQTPMIYTLKGITQSTVMETVASDAERTDDLRDTKSEEDTVTKTQRITRHSKMGLRGTVKTENESSEENNSLTSGDETNHKDNDFDPEMDIVNTDKLKRNKSNTKKCKRKMLKRQAKKTDTDSNARDNSNTNIIASESEQEDVVCPTCKTQLATKSELINHIRNVHPSEVCPICEHSFFNISSRNKHIETHNTHKGYKCDMCSTACKSKSNLYIHMRRMHGKSKHECPDCGAQYNDSNKYNTHLRTHDKSVTFRCKTCEKVFKSPNGLKTHEFLHTGLKPFLCNECGIGFATRGVLNGHFIQVHTNERRYKCNICGKGFHKRRQFNMHMQIHDGSQPRPFVCEHCGKDFTLQSTLKNHLRTHTGEKPFKCDSCDLAFTQKGMLNSHNLYNHGGPPKKKGLLLPKPLEVVAPMPVLVEQNAESALNTIDTKKLPFICTECKKGFRLPVSLSRHFKRHHTTTHAYPCNMCTLSFKSKNILDTHVKGVHLKLRPHICQVCFKGFPKPSVLNVHMLRHTGEKPFTCTVCNKSFALRVRLKLHMRTHTGERLFKCEICSEDFKTYKVLADHLGRKHKNWTTCSTDDLQDNIIEGGKSSNSYSTVVHIN